MQSCEAALATTHSHSAFWRTQGSSHTLQGSHEGFSALMLFTVGSPQPLGALETEDWGAHVNPSPGKCKQDPLWAAPLGLNLQQMLWYLQAFPSPCSSDCSLFIPPMSLLDRRGAGNAVYWVLSEAPARVTVTPVPSACPPPTPCPVTSAAQVLSACFPALPKPGII